MKAVILNFFVLLEQVTRMRAKVNTVPSRGRKIRLPSYHRYRLSSSEAIPTTDVCLSWGSRGKHETILISDSIIKMGEETLIPHPPPYTVE